jgi:hypothetical protein
MTDKNIYSYPWKKYRRLSRLSWIIVLTYAPGVLIIGGILYAVSGSETPIYVVAIMWMLAVVISGNRVIGWKCPRCGKSFFTAWFIRNPFAIKCFHCGLPKWSLSDPDQE